MSEELPSEIPPPPTPAPASVTTDVPEVSAPVENTATVEKPGQDDTRAAMPQATIVGGGSYERPANP